MQPAGAQPDPDPIVHQHLDAVAAAIGEQVRMMRACFAEHAHHPPNHAPQAAAAASGQLTFTTDGPRRSSITISRDATGAELCTSTGTNAAFAAIGAPATATTVD